MTLSASRTTTTRSAPKIDAAAFSARAEAFVARHAASPTTHYIRNVDARVDALRVDGVTLPVCENRPDIGNAWVVSPLTTYRDYALEEIDCIGPRAVAAPLRALAQAAGGWLRRARLDDAVSVNCWLVSTNSYPDLDAAHIARIADAARARWPHQAIWFRSLNVPHDRVWLTALRAAGATLVPSRQVYLFDDIDRHARARSDLRRDLALLRRSGMQRLHVEALDADDHARIAVLYAMLYLDKYSRLNPDYTSALIAGWHRDGLLDLHGLRDAAGTLIAAVGMLRFGNLVTAPIVGYDTSLPQRLGLYRLLTATVLEVARRDDGIVNLSAGVPHFKRQRGGVGAIEYSAVLADHLPAARRRALHALGAVTRCIGVPFMRRYRL